MFCFINFAAEFAIFQEFGIYPRVKNETIAYLKEEAKAKYIFILWDYKEVYWKNE